MRKVAIFLAFIYCGAQSVMASEFEWKDPSGATHSLAEYRGKPVILHLWTSWCFPCRNEMPEVATWLKQHPEVTFIPVSLDSDSQDAEAFLQQQHIAIPVLISDEGQALGIGARGLPTTAIVDASGEIRQMWLGVQQWQSPAWNTKLLSALQ